MIDRIQVFTLKVFDQRKLACFTVRKITDDDRNLRKPDQLCSTPAALAGNNLIALLPDGAHKDRLQNAMLLD